MSEPEPLALLPHEEPLPPRVDLWTAAVFSAFGLAIIYVSWQMPTYREQLGQIYTAPGLVPIFYGIVIAVLGLWLAARSIGRGAFKPQAKAPPAKDEGGYGAARLVAASVVGLLYSVGMITRLPFWLATAIFVFLFIMLFEWRKEHSWRQRLRPMITAALIGIGTGWGVVFVFQRIFLVRLP
jgi:hypothetical protein